MAVHNDLRSMSIGVIDEYLSIAEHCVTTPKANGGVYGYPAVLLLFCVVDALSNYAGHPKHSFAEMRSVFPDLTDKQLIDLKRWYRNLLAHQAIIMPGTQLSPESAGRAIEFGPTGEPTHIRVVPLYEAVKRWWETFDKTSINPKFKQAQSPNEPLPTTTSPLPGASGCYVTSTIRRS